MAENPQPAPSGQEPLPPNASDENQAVAGDLTVPEVFVLITALLLLVALGRAVEPILSPFVLIGALLFILYPLRHNRLVSRLTILGSVFFVLCAKAQDGHPEHALEHGAGRQTMALACQMFSWNCPGSPLVLCFGAVYLPVDIRCRI